MGGAAPSRYPRGIPFLVAGGVATLGAAIVDRALYDMTESADDLGATFLFQATKRSFAVAGGVLIAIGAACEIGRRLT